MMSYRVLTLLLVTILSGTSMANPLIKSAEQHQFVEELQGNIKLEVGSMLMLNQRLKENIAEENPYYFVVFKCQHKQRTDECELFNVDFQNK